jgi:hypothetical protein
MLSITSDCLFGRCSWTVRYATKDLMRLIEPLRKIYDCRSRRIAKWMIPVECSFIGASCAGLAAAGTLAQGKRIKIKGFPKDPQGTFVPGGGIYSPHGWGRDQRPYSDCYGGCTKGAQIRLSHNPKVSPAPSPGVIDDAGFASASSQIQGR